MPLASGPWASYVKPLQPSGNSDALECQRDCQCFRSGSGVTAFPIRTSADNAVNKGTKERLMDSRFGLQLLSTFVDETLEMPRQLDVEARLEQDPVLRRKCKPFAAWAQPFAQTASATRHPMDSMRAFARRVRSA